MEHHVHLDNYQACRMCIERENRIELLEDSRRSIAERSQAELDAAITVIERLKRLLNEHVDPSSSNFLD